MYCLHLLHLPTDVHVFVYIWHIYLLAKKHFVYINYLYLQAWMWFSALFHEDFYPDLGTESNLHTAVILGLNLNTRLLQSPIDQVENYAEYNPGKFEKYKLYVSFKSKQKSIVVEIYFGIVNDSAHQRVTHRIQKLIFCIELPCILKHFAAVPPLQETDVDTYFLNFQKITKWFQWPKEYWITLLQKMLTGRRRKNCSFWLPQASVSTLDAFTEIT